MIGCACALEPGKGLETLLEGVARGRLPDAAVVLAGRGSLETELKRQVQDLAFPVLLPGWLDDVSSFLAALDVFVLPSRREGMPLAVLEAMAAGLPIVASRVGGIPEALRDGAAGILTPPGDADAIGAALRRLALEDDLASRLGDEAHRVWGAEHRADVMIERTAALYRVLAGRGAVGAESVART